jgi:magnesium transporter
VPLPPIPSVLPRTHNARILIADDMSVNVELLARVLRLAGYTDVTTATDPTTICDLHRANRYDLILLDLQMPVMDGFEVMEGLHAIEVGSYIPVVVITAQPNHKLQALQAGARDFVSKPFDQAEVLARVNNVLEVRMLYSALRDEKERSAALLLQPGAMVGMEGEERMGTPWKRSLRLRNPWLQINLFTAFTAAAVVGMFQGTLDRLLILSIFLPVLAGQSGNTGSQALAITLRRLTLGDLQRADEVRTVRREVLLGLLNGALVGVAAAVAMFLVARAQHLAEAPMLAAVVFFAMVGSCVIGGVSGALVPLTLARLGADPVIASSIVLTTATDVASMGLFLGLARLFVV